MSLDHGNDESEYLYKKFTLLIFFTKQTNKQTKLPNTKAITMSLDLVIFENVFKCPKCKMTYLEECFTRDSRNLEWGSNTKLCKNMCNACFAHEKCYYHIEEDLRKHATDTFARYERKVREASEPSKFSSSEIAAFSKKVRDLSNELEKQIDVFWKSDNCYDCREGPGYTAEKRYEMKMDKKFDTSERPKLAKIMEHWIWNASLDTYVEEKKTDAKPKITLDDNTMKYVNRFKDSSDPIKEATKYREEYKKQYYEVEERSKFYEHEYNHAKNYPGQQNAKKKLDEKKEIMTAMISNIESLKKTINYFLSM